MNEIHRSVTAEEVVAAILAEFDKTTMPGYYVDYVHNWFRVYLSPPDFAVLKPFEARVREEAVRALDEHLKAMNGGVKAGWARLTGKTKPCERLGEWMIEFHWSDEVQAGGLEVQSEGAAYSEPEAFEGAETIKRVAPVAEQDLLSRTKKTDAAAARVERAQAFAKLTWQDDEGSHTYEMFKESINVGRGGANTLVDIAIVGPKDISRLHFQIRRDAATGKFSIKDLSRFGTWVDGRRLPPSANIENGTERDLQIYVPLAEHAQISLAEKLTVKFKAGGLGKLLPWL